MWPLLASPALSPVTLPWAQSHWACRSLDSLSLSYLTAFKNAWNGLSPTILCLLIFQVSV